MNRKLLLLGALLSALLLAGAGQIALAQSRGNLNLTTSPLPISLKTKPGSSVTADLRVQNSGTQTESLKVDLYKFRAYGDSGKPQIIDREPGDNYFDWVSFSERTFRAEPNVWKTIKMTINVPEEAAFGYYYAVVFSRADQARPEGSQNADIVGGSATLVLLEADVPGAKRQVEVINFKADRKFYEFLPADFTVALKNNGQVHAAPTGTLFISRGGKQIATIQVNAEAGNILPSSSRSFSVSWDDGFPVYVEKTAGNKTDSNIGGQMQRELKWDFDKPFNKLRIGKYTAKLVMVYDDGKRDVPVEGSLSFWVVPWKLLTGLSFLLLLVGFLIYRYITIQRRLKRLTAKEKQGKS